MIILKLAYRNLVGAGLRTWLNGGVLSFTYVLIIWHQGLFSGMYEQASRNVIKDEIGGGQYWVDRYDPYDPMTLEESHGLIPSDLSDLKRQKRAAPILIRQGTMYPGGRMQSVLIKGIDPGQKILDIPTDRLLGYTSSLPVMVGKITARKNAFSIGDTITLRWRDANGTFDAADGEIVAIMNTDVPTMDMGQLWIPLDRLQKMSGLKNEATIIVVGEGVHGTEGIPGWMFKGHDYLLKDINDMVRSKRVGGMVLYAILLFLSMLAIFDTQVLSIFRRRKEIGTLMALGMLRSRVVALFTFEGAMHGLLGIALAALYGIPVLVYSAKTGIPIPGTGEEYGFAISTRLFPAYSAWLVGATVLIVMATVTIVSYLPSRKITGINPTETLKGKIS
jgi:ABC-type lipoprotein release transport system permease subunit